MFELLALDLFGEHCFHVIWELVILTQIQLEHFQFQHVRSQRSVRNLFRSRNVIPYSSNCKTKFIGYRRNEIRTSRPQCEKM